MSLSGSARLLGVSILAAAALTLSGCGKRDELAPRGPAQITFSILSAQGQASSGPLWQPLLDDLAKVIDVPVSPHFASTYATLIADMKRGQTQVAWFSAQPAVDAIDNADAELIARTVNLEGSDSYRATLIVRRGSGITLQDVLDCGKGYRFGTGDPLSTSGTLAPAAHLFHPRGIEPTACFGTIRSGNHETNTAQVASGVLDVATSNSAAGAALRRRNPMLADQIEQIWQSPPIPEGGILLRSDLDPAVKEKIRSFFLTYGQGDGAEPDRQRRVLAGLGYSRFSAADDDYLNPVREMIVGQTLIEARGRNDAAAVATAEQELQRLRVKREVQP